MNWTKEQEQVIYVRNCNILVSAAAGSGKTTVLIERILSRIMDRQNPANVDEFLIVTFTKAAAAHMKDKLQQTLEEALAAQPDNEHLQRQVMLVPAAQISTIHSFCSYVIQNYFHRTGVDPAYRLGADNEMAMVRSDVIGELLEDKYEEAEESFLYVASMSRFVKSDAEIEAIVLSLYEKAMSDPFPLQFLERMKEFAGMRTMEELKQSEFVRKNKEYADCFIKGMCGEYRSMIALCDEPGGPPGYRQLLFDEMTAFEQIARTADFEEMGRRIRLFEFKRLPAKKYPDEDLQKREAVKKMRDAVKGVFASFSGDLFDRPLDGQIRQLGKMGGIITVFVDLTIEFMERYRKKKSEKGLADYDDLEQMALEILITRDEDGNVCRTDAARELSEQFVEIMIDEYQDSNLVQEMILGSVSTENNRFMVGDIKQSIYRFRMACPDLFLEKMNHYSTDEGAENRLINLSRNFRSRETVLEAANALFEKIMHRALGGVEYDEAARLRPGTEFPETDENVAKGVDIHVLDGSDDGSREGRMIAGIIKEYTGDENPLYVLDGGEYRKVQYGDIVILARSTKVFGQQIYDVLAAEGIPVHMEHAKGFFGTREITIMVNLFEVIDNPRQDIPLAAVMTSPVGGFTEDELVIIRGKQKNRDFYESLMSFANGESVSGQEELRRKAASFLDMINGFREKMTYVTVADMIQEIYSQTHIDYILMAMKNGAQRKANLEMLMELAREFDGTSYRGLYQFVRYISGIKKREEDLGEANMPGSGDGVVKIMTIHKSKGLEFPVCILAGMGKGFRGRRSKPFLVVNPSVGIASRVIDNERGISVNNTFYRSLSRMNEMEDLGEELRVLYVAMTRAKEKLVMTGAVPFDKVPRTTGYFQMVQGNCYFDWILPAILDNPLFSVHRILPEEIEQREIQRQADLVIDTVMFNNCDTNVVYDKKTQDMLSFMERRGEEKTQELPTKLTVSEIKRRSLEEQAEEEFSVFGGHDPEDRPPIPKFAREEPGADSAAAGAGYGTVWHQVMAGLNFSDISSEKELEIELQNMVESGRVRRGDIDCVNAHKIMRFLRSPLGSEMQKAAENGTLYREQPFVIGVRAGEVLPETDSDDTVLVQGIIDAFFEAEDGIVLMDYKTDHIEKGEEQVLVLRYREQIELYARALERITGRKVARRVLYSFSLNKVIEI